MRQFSDTQGRAWQIVLTLGTAIQVRNALSVDLLTPEGGDPPLLSRLATDEFLLGSVICELLRRQMEAYKLTPDDVYAAFDGATLLAAQDAFFAELADFFQSRGRPDRATAVKKQAALMRAAINLAQSRVEAIRMEALGAPSGASPE